MSSSESSKQMHLGGRWDTHVVHPPEEGRQEWIPFSEITKLDIHGVHLLKIIKSVTHEVRL